MSTNVLVIVDYEDARERRRSRLEEFFKNRFTVRGYSRADDVPREERRPPTRGMLIHQGNWENGLCGQFSIPIVHFSGGRASLGSACQPDREVIFPCSLAATADTEDPLIRDHLGMVADWFEAGGEVPRGLLKDPFGLVSLACIDILCAAWQRLSSRFDAGSMAGFWAPARDCLAELRARKPDEQTFWLNLRSSKAAEVKMNLLIARDLRGDDALSPGLRDALRQARSEWHVADGAALHEAAVRCFESLCTRISTGPAPEVAGISEIDDNLVRSAHLAYCLLASVHL